MPASDRARTLSSVREQDQTKICASCGREMRWRAAWAEVWDEVRYCSAACRSRKVTPQDRELEAAILRLLDRRAAKAAIDPSDAAHSVGGDAGHALREPARRAARRLAAAGLVHVVQNGRVVDAATVRGPFLVRRHP